jgi:hypothetical protein
MEHVGDWAADLENQFQLYLIMTTMGSLNAILGVFFLKW